MSESSSAKDFQREYEALSPTLHRFHSEIARQLADLLEQRKVALSVPLQSRVKSWSSLREKIESVFVPSESIKEVNDLVGFRIILQFRRDIDAVCEFLSATLSVKKQYNTADRLQENQFGYSSTHLIVEVPQTWLKVPSFSMLAGLQAEIQVRTAAQHIWATTSQTFQYKQESSVPVELRRSIYRLSALLETVDLEVERLRSERGDYRAIASRAVDPGSFLNVDLVEQALDEVWPAKNKGDPEDYAELLDEIFGMEIATFGDLLTMLQKHKESALKADRERVIKELENLTFDDDAERIQNGVFFTHVGLTRHALGAEFKKKWTDFSSGKFARRRKKSRPK